VLAPPRIWPFLGGRKQPVTDAASHLGLPQRPLWTLDAEEEKQGAGAGFVGVAEAAGAWRLRAARWGRGDGGAAGDGDEDDEHEGAMDPGHRGILSSAVARREVL